MQNSILETIQKSKISIFPILGHKIKADDVCEVDLSIFNSEFDVIDVKKYEGLEAYLSEVLMDNYAKVGMGGYGEHRIVYDNSVHFNEGDGEPRCIHLGIDLWAEEHTVVYAPFDSKVHSFKYNNQPLDYGATIILEHEIEHTKFYTLYGHLTLNSIQKLKEGQIIKAGEAFTKIGYKEENGGWPPHLHFQVITNLLGWKGDYPGVATERESNYYMSICPNPELFVSQYIKK
jgi:peptidoglycan LD-endopeptidase LytH